MRVPIVLLGVGLLAFGAVSFWDAYRISSTLRLRGTLDVVGPDRYLFGLTVLLLIMGGLLIIKGVPAWRAQAVTAEPGTRDKSNRHMALFAILLAYILLMPFLGYAFSSLVFFLALFRTMGMTNWISNTASSVALTAIFFLAFVFGADMPLPAGVLGLG